MSETPRPFRRPLLGALAGLSLMVLLASAACTKPDPLAPLAALAHSAVSETVDRVDKAHAFLADEVMPHPQIADLYAPGGADTRPDAEKDQITWGSTPYIAVAAYDADGKLLATLPHVSPDLDPLLETAATGPDVGDLMVIPNTFAFTLGMRQPVKGHAGATVSALLDVDKVLVQGVLNPVAEAADGFAFLADAHHNVVLTTLPALAGRALAHFHIPVPEPGKDATATVTIAGRPYDVGVSAATGPHPWVFGIGAPPVAPPAASGPAPEPPPPGSPAVPYGPSSDAAPPATPDSSAPPAA